MYVLGNETKMSTYINNLNISNPIVAFEQYTPKPLGDCEKSAMTRWSVRGQPHHYIGIVNVARTIFSPIHTTERLFRGRAICPIGPSHFAGII